MERRDFFKGMAGTAIGVGGFMSSSTGSFTNHRFSLVPSFKTQIKVTGDDAWLYIECHDVGNFDADSRFIAADAFLAGTIRRVGGRWLFWNMTAGSARPLSADHYYFP